MSDVAVALVVFNRPDLAAAQLTRLAASAPTRLYVIADGPRSVAEANLCQETQRAVHDGLTWPANVTWDVAKTNLGLRQRILTGLDRVFEQESAAIVLEDDVEVSPAFFNFAAEHLATHRHDRNVGSISARNLLVAYGPADEPILSDRASVWGWATWADRWQQFRAEFDPADSDLADRMPATIDPTLRSVLAHLHRRQLKGIDQQEWSLQWAMWHAIGGRKNLASPRNLAVNHGFRADATNTAVPGDLRGAFPMLNPDTPAPPDLGLNYDDAHTLLELMVLYQHPRRWRLLAAQAERQPDGSLDEGMRLLLEPWRRRDDSRAVLNHLANFVDSPHLLQLQEALA